MPTEEIKIGKYKHYHDGSVIVVKGIAQHTEADYRLVIHHPDGMPDSWKARPVGVFTERIPTKDGSVLRWRPIAEKS